MITFTTTLLLTHPGWLKLVLKYVLVNFKMSLLLKLTFSVNVSKTY